MKSVKSKHRNIKTEYNGRAYDSKKEAERARVLDVLKQSGKIKSWIPQPSFPLPGGYRYMPDFLVIENDGTFRIEDVKAWDRRKKKFRETRVSINKRKQFQAEYGLEVELV